jgi:N-acetylglucosamine-6-phosphate deacetylase
MLEAGARADVVLLTEALDVALTLVGGEVAHDGRTLR